MKQYWNTNCLACHATDLRFNFDPKTGKYSTHWIELAIGCEACHNPGSKHNEFFEDKYRRVEAREELNDTYISNQRYFDWVRNTELCASCHGTKVNYFLGYWPGDQAYDYFAPTLLNFHGPDQMGDWYPDGRPTRFNHFMDFMGSRCFLEGKATCISCHEGHSSQNDSLLLVPREQSNTLCLNCHQEKYGDTKLVQHTFHLPDSPGSRCFECHMGESLERVMMHRRDHSLDNPIPENSIRYGVPNACNNRNCHPDKTAEWSIRTLDQWYGSQNRQKVLYAPEALWLAKAGDPKAIPLLLRVMKDTNLRITMRASAAAMVGQVFGAQAKEAVPSLVAMLNSDNHLMQIAAVQSLGYIAAPEALQPLSKLLEAPARVVRSATAAAMLNLGIVKLDGPAGEEYERAKGEWVEALKGWPNVPEFRLNLGSYHMLHKDYKDAITEYEIAVQLNPGYVEGYYYLGRAYAYTMQLEKAIQAWKKTRELSPGFQDVDKLIAAAEQDLKKR